MKTINFDSQFFLVKFPIIFPIIYGLILFNFPQYETELIVITILLLAETHFGATWPFFLDKMNYQFIKEKRFSLFAIPILIALLSILGFFTFNKFFLLVFFAANMYHVTRQSFGVGKLYCKDITEKKFQEFFIYIINFLFFLIGYLKFYLNIINESNFFLINIIVLSFLSFLFLIYIIKFGFSENFLVFVTGCLIFYPVCFVNNPVHAIIMGVTMHYTQYIYFTFNVCHLRNKDDISHKNETLFSKRIKNYLFVVVIYSILMSILSSMGKYNGDYLKNLIIIPIVGQMLHFYLDSQLWKFSESINRNNTLKYLSKIINND